MSITTNQTNKQSMEDICGICMDGFNKSARKQVTCPYCSQSCCRTCVQRYLLEDTAESARCPQVECRLGWSDDFLTQSMTKSFLLGDYKRHRETVLVDAERARLPETQENAARYRSSKQVVAPIDTQIADLSRQLKELPETQAFDDATHAYYRSALPWADRKPLHQSYRQARANYYIASTPLQVAIARLKTHEYRNALYFVSQFGRPRPTRQGRNQTEEPRSSWNFVMKCPAGDCQGFVGLNWKCGLCATHVCKECRDPLMASLEDATHVCDPEKVLTAKAIQKEAKPCPNCASQISKIDGCDQMWCTQCQTAFSWRTGEIETRVHNPHYFEWMRRNGTPATPAAPPVQNAECLTPVEVIEQVIYYNRENHDIMTWCRFMRHYQAEIRYLNRLTRDEKTETKKHNLRVQRLVSEIDDTAWKVALQRIEKAQQKNRRVMQVIELYVQAGIDILRESLLETADKAAVCQQLVELRTYCNDQLLAIQTRYKNVVPDLMSDNRVYNY